MAPDQQPVPEVDLPSLQWAIEQALCGGGEEQFTLHVTHREVAEQAIQGVLSWLTGRRIINLPAPDEPGGTTWIVPGVGPTPELFTIEAARDSTGRAIVQLLDADHHGDYVLPADQFRLMFLAGLAACDRAEQLPPKVTPRDSCNTCWPRACGPEPFRSDCARRTTGDSLGPLFDPRYWGDNGDVTAGTGGFDWKYERPYWVRIPAGEAGQDV